MKKAKSILALILALVMALALVACGGNGGGDKPAPGGDKPTPGGDDPTPAKEQTLQVAYAPFNSKFSPFFAQTAYDQDAQGMTQIGLLTTDRVGSIVMKGIEGETRDYNGKDYTYYGPANLTITENADGTVYYDFKLRDDLKFSDGTPVTMDDVIFSMYVLADPTYDGSSSFYAQPIQGMAEYRSGMENLVDLLLKAGRDNADFTYWTEEQQTAFWASIDATIPKFAETIGNEILAKYGASYELETFADACALWGFEGVEDAEGFTAALIEKYHDDIAAMAEEKCTTVFWDLMEDYSNYTIGIQTGNSAPSITGIQKIDDYNLRIVLTEVNAVAIYQLGVTITPLHYYGDKAQYDYANNKFGFPKGDLSSVRAKTTQPMGAGPYKFIKYANAVINYEANENYYQGCPKIKYLNFVETNSDDQKLNGVITGTVDVTDPSFGSNTVESIKKANSNGEVTGDKITTNTVDNLGYGYIGQNAVNVKVGNDPASDASKALRHAFATVFSVYRDVAIDSYYGERASVINYPISNTSWAAPRPSDEGYQIAFSVDVDGNPLYTSGMSDEEKYAAALQGALGFFEKAGYTVTDGKLTAAPEGAKMEYTFWIPADGTGDHPSFMICTEAAKALETIGMKLNVKDLSNSQELWNNLNTIQVEMWAAAWGATVDPDMTQIYFADVANGPTTTEGKNPMGGPNQGGSNYEYCIADAELDKNIKAALASTDQSYRKAMYKACLDIVIDWAVEVPTYQRQNAIIFSTERVNLDTVTPDITTFYPWMSEIQNMEMK